MGLEVFTGKIEDLVVTNPTPGDVKSQGDDHIRGIKLTIKEDCVSKSDNVTVPPGSVSMFAGASAPNGWFICNGQLVSRTTYASLFAAIGTTFGVGDGSTTFAVPDLRGQFVRGLDAGKGIDTGRALGSSQTDDNKSHTHTGTTGAGSAHSHTGTTSTDGTHNHNPAPYGGVSWGLVTINNTFGAVQIGGSSGLHAGLMTDNGSHSHTVTVSNESVHTHPFTTNASGTESRPVNVALNYIIKF